MCLTATSALRGQGVAPPAPPPAPPAAVGTGTGTGTGASAGAGFDTIKAATPAPTAEITKLLADKVAALASEDPTAAAAARDQIISAVSQTGGVNPSPAFLTAFAAALDTGIGPALQHPSDRVRMNAGIAVARVAQATNDPALRGATMALLNDKSGFVALWGMKAAKSVLPAALRNPAAKAEPLMDAIVKAVATHGAGTIAAPIAAEAYETLTVDALSDDPKKRPGPAITAKVLPFMHRLLQQRVKAYQQGVPPEPLADSRGTLFLVDTRVWGAHTPEQKVASIQAMSDMIGLAAQHLQSAGPAERESLNLAIRYVGGAIAVVPETQPIAAQLKPIAAINAQAQPGAVQAAVAAVHPALITIPTFAKLTPPPQATARAPDAAAAAPAEAAGGAGGTTRPATTAPTTSPAAATVPSTAAAMPTQSSAASAALAH